jgi:hypothetical protein
MTLRSRTALCILPILPLGLVACSGADTAATEATSDTEAPLAWVTPLTEDVVRVGEPIELAVQTRDLDAGPMHFEIDGREIFACDPLAESEDCRLGTVSRWTTTRDTTGRHTLRAWSMVGGVVVEATHAIDVADAEPGELGREDFSEAVSGDAPDLVGAPVLPPAEDTSDVEAASRGSLDPSHGYHSFRSGVAWAVSNQRVLVRRAPGGSVSAVTACMKRYGTSIRRWADFYKLSRASVVATAITESNCTNPRGSSDGLSSGPMQVTASTCSAITGVSRSTCRVRMHSSPDFSFRVGVKYMSSSYQRRQHHRDPPKIAAAYNAGSVRYSSANRWHMLVTGNHIERWVGAYNAYRSWESKTTRRAVAHDVLREDLTIERPLVSVWNGEHVALPTELPSTAPEGTSYFVGDWAHRDGQFYERVGNAWIAPAETDD